MATVVPMRIASRASIPLPLYAMAFIIASTGRDLVDRVLATTSSPVTSSIPIRSVNVPRVSIPRRTAIAAPISRRSSRIMSALESHSSIPDQCEKFL